MPKQTVQSNINLESLAGGAFAEKLNEALMQVAENIQNPNTEATTKRQIQILLKFAPNKSACLRPVYWNGEAGTRGRRLPVSTVLFLHSRQHLPGWLPVPEALLPFGRYRLRQ